jgi:hypothetical protein
MITTLAYSETLLPRIRNLMINNVSYLRAPGLKCGKMGASISLFHYASNTQTSHLEDLAFELLEDVYGLVNQKTGTDPAAGLAGIGWGIIYLNQQGMLSVDLDEVLSDIDKLLDVESLSGQGTGEPYYRSLAGKMLYLSIRYDQSKLSASGETYLFLLDRYMQYLIEYAEIQTGQYQYECFLQLAVFSCLSGMKTNASSSRLQDHLIKLLTNYERETIQYCLLSFLIRELVERVDSFPSFGEFTDLITALEYQLEDIRTNQLPYSSLNLLAIIIDALYKKNNFTPLSDLRNAVVSAISQITTGDDCLALMGLRQKGRDVNFGLIGGLSGYMLTIQALNSDEAITANYWQILAHMK